MPDSTAAAKKRGSGSRAKKATGGYSAKQLRVLEGLDAVRKRPGMYIGSTDGRGLMHCLWEILDNSVDEALGGWCTEIEVHLFPDGSVEVRDDGRGIPVDKEPKTRMTGVEVVMTKLHAGGKFGDGSYAASGGLHGVGASVVNALSERLDVEVDRDRRIHVISFRRGVPGLFDGDGPDAEFKKKAGLQDGGRCSPKKTGTRVRWWADRQIFTADAGYDLDILRARIQQTTFLVPGVTIRLLDERNPEEVVDESFAHRGGIVDYVDHLAVGEPVTNVVELRGSDTFTETVPVLDDAGHMTPQDVERDLTVDVALRWSNGYDTVLKSFVNIIATPKGGTHVTGFERALTRTFNERLKSAKVLKSGEDNVTKDDVLEGITAVVSVRLAEPQFEGQTKEVLGTPAVTKIVQKVVSEQLAEWMRKPPRGDKQSVKLALEKVANAMRARVSARATRDLQRRKNALESSSLPAKLVDCRTSKVDESELFIVEGDSALGTAKLARESEGQALLPIRGKILNVQKASVADMLKNAECAAIIQVIGAGSGRTFDIDQVRYGKIIMMSDADVDGAHIRCLLLTLFYRYMRPLLEDGRVYAAVPPLHRIETVAAGKRNGEVIYTYNEDQMHETLRDLDKRNVRVKDPVQRYKGLGEMDARQLRETTMSRQSRTLRRVQVEDAEAAEEVFHLLMGNDVAPRKEFLVTSSEQLDRERIDA
ncbi:MAG: type IIA DNA topoisomerase subunit B [Actinomycetia bacterium]|nr:type IIA DNA topoisomerase subunit B [Actinomycetes bacterium]MCH9800235.1 type IIA DNA topoisomerase subunit B [Actinomycetes bacterium]